MPLLIFHLVMDPGKVRVKTKVFLILISRACIGQRFARLELFLMMVKIVQRFKMEYNGEEVGTITELVTQPDKPINIKFTER